MVVFIYHKQLLLTWRCIKWCLRYHTNQHHFMVLCSIKYFMEHFFVSKCQTTTRLMQPAIINNIMNKRVQSFPNHTYVFVNLFPVLFFSCSNTWDIETDKTIQTFFMTFRYCTGTWNSVEIRWVLFQKVLETSILEI